MCVCLFVLTQLLDAVAHQLLLFLLVADGVSLQLTCLQNHKPLNYELENYSLVAIRGPKT